MGSRIGARKSSSDRYDIDVLTKEHSTNGGTSLRILAADAWRGRLAKLGTVPIVAMVLAACTEQANTNPTGDDAAPNLFGETANGIGFPHEVVTTEGIAAAGLYLPIFIIAVIIFVLIEGLLIYMALRYRRRSKGDDLPQQVHGSNRLEIIWTVIPAIVVAVLFIGSTIVLLDIESESDDPAVVVDVTGFRFGWIFDYMEPDSFDEETSSYEPTGVQVTGGGRENAPVMVLPVGEPVRFRVTAADVIHSFYVPAFFFKRDAIPGRTNEFEVTIEKPGIYGGQCAEFCGLAHGDMYFSVDAREPAEYEAWFTAQLGETPATADAEPAEAEPADAEGEADTSETTEAERAEPEPDADENSEEAA